LKLNISSLQIIWKRGGKGRGGGGDGASCFMDASRRSTFKVKLNSESKGDALSFLPEEKKRGREKGKRERGERTTQFPVHSSVKQ